MFSAFYLLAFVGWEFFFIVANLKAIKCSILSIVQKYQSEKESLNKPEIEKKILHSYRCVVDGKLLWWSLITD